MLVNKPSTCFSPQQCGDLNLQAFSTYLMPHRAERSHSYCALAEIPMTRIRVHKKVCFTPLSFTVDVKGKY
jgi:hypothetical protein